MLENNGNDLLYLFWVLWGQNALRKVDGGGREDRRGTVDGISAITEMR